MTGKLSRRNFLKIIAGTGVVTGLGSKIRRVALEPYLRPPEEELPGRATWYASTCRQCPAGCGIIVRVINGRPRKIEGNPAHPLNRGKLCARGQAGLQMLYNPDRLQNAVHQIGGRASRQFEPIQWTEAVERLTSTLRGLQDPEQVAFIAGLMPDHLYAIVSTFLEALGSPAPVLFDLHTALEGRSETAEMADRWFGSQHLPTYDLANAEVIFSFGANFLETWMSPVAQSFDYGTMRQGQVGGRGFLVQFEPRLSATAASADEWIPVVPGTEGLIALGLGRIIVEDNLGRVGSHREYAYLYRDVNVGQVVEATGITAEDLQRLARVFADADRQIAIPGGSLAGHTNASSAMDAVMALNVIMRRLGHEGGVFLPQDVPAETFAPSADPTNYREVIDLIERMRKDQVEVLFIHGANPAYELPSRINFAEALGHVPLVVSFSPVIDETAVLADYVLPDHTYLESWGQQTIKVGSDRPAVSSQQPVAKPLYDTRSTSDVFLMLASQLGGAVSAVLPWTDEVAYLEESTIRLLGSSIGIVDARTPSGFWSYWRQLGGWWSKNPIRREPETQRILSKPVEVPSATFFGDEEQYPYFLIPYESVTLSDGRGANLPLLQETPDPMTTARWDTWIEINPETAHRLGVTDNDLVRVSSPYGELEAAVVVYPGIRPDVVAIPTGQGHEDFGRYAAGRGANVMELIAPAPEPVSGNMTWAAMRVHVEKIDNVKVLARLESLEGEGRDILR